MPWLYLPPTVQFQWLLMHPIDCITLLTCPLTQTKTRWTRIRQSTQQSHCVPLLHCLQRSLHQQSQTEQRNSTTTHYWKTKTQKTINSTLRRRLSHLETIPFTYICTKRTRRKRTSSSHTESKHQQLLHRKTWLTLGLSPRRSLLLLITKTAQHHQRRQYWALQ